MGAQDYMVGNAPGGASYQMGNMAQQLFQMLSGLPKQYEQGQDFQYKQRQQNLFQDSDSQAMLQDALKSGNYAPVLQKMIRAQGAGAAPVIGQLMSDQAGARLAESITGGGTQPAATNTSTTLQNATQLAKGAERINGGAPNNSRIPYTDQPSPTDNAGGESIRTLTAGIANGRPVQDAAMANYARAIGVSDPDAPLSAEQEARARKIIGNNLGGVSGQSPPPATNDAASGGSPINSAAAPQGNESPAVGSGGGAPISPAPTAAAGGGAPMVWNPGKGTLSPAGAGGAPQPSGPQVAQAAPRDTLTAADRGIRPTPVGTEAQAQAAEQQARKLRALQAYWAGRNPKSAEAVGARAAEEEKRAHEIRDSLGKYNEPGTNPDVQSTLKTFEGAGTAMGKRIGEVIEGGGKDARKTVNVLDIMTDALHQGGDHIFAGPGSDIALKVKQAAANLGWDIKGTNESETVQKLNAQLASAAAKAMTARPSQLEFKAFMANNPGLVTSTKGSLILADVLRQLTKQDIELSRKATNKANWNNWADIEDKFYSQNPIKSPFTGKPLKGDEVVPGLGGAPSGAAPGLPKGVRSIEVVK